MDEPTIKIYNVLMCFHILPPPITGRVYSTHMKSSPADLPFDFLEFFLDILNFNHSSFKLPPVTFEFVFMEDRGVSNTCPKAPGKCVIVYKFGKKILAFLEEDVSRDTFRSLIGS